MRHPLTFDPERFVSAQEPVYASVLAELRAGRKRSHWMWFVFPQLAGLGRSSTARFYALASLNEATVYLDHPVLGARLRECSSLVAELPDGAEAIFGLVDALKLRSSMTLFAAAAPTEKVFLDVLARHYGGATDPETERLLEA